MKKLGYSFKSVPKESVPRMKAKLLLKRKPLDMRYIVEPESGKQIDIISNHKKEGNE